MTEENQNPQGGNRRHKVRSSAEPDYSARDKLLDALAAHDKKIAAYTAAAQEHLNLADSERLVKAEMLRKTGLAKFVNRRLEEKGIKFEHGGFSISSNAMLVDGTTHYIVDTEGEAFPENVQKIKRRREALVAIGIPEDHIKMYICYYHPRDGQGKPSKDITLPAEYPYVLIDDSVINGLIEKAVEDRFAPIKAQYDRAAAGAKEALSGISKMIEEVTDKEVADSAPESQLGFAAREHEALKADIRRKVIDDIAGYTLDKSKADEGRGR